MLPASIAAALAVLLIINGIALLPPIFMAWLDSDPQLQTLLALCIGQLLVGIPVLARLGRLDTNLRNRDGFVLVALMWLSISLIGAVPFVLCLGMPVADAIFESASGFTTTGATTLIGLDELPRSILLYRQEIQWLGGIGVIVSALALLPILGVGGMQLIKAEAPGRAKSDKLTPRIRQTVSVIWRVYLGITVACALLYWVSSMSPFDAVAHALSTVSTGGYSTHDASIGFFHSAGTETVAVVFMALGSINFSLHFFAITQQSLRAYWDSEEVRAFLVTLLVVSLAVTAMLIYSGRNTGVDAWRTAAFQVVSVMTSTGFATDNFATWPLFLPVLLIFISFVGGCAGSTAGGMKVLRFVVLGKQAGVELQRLIHPQLVRQVSFEQRTVPDSVVQSIWAFFATYVVIFAVLMLCLMADGMDQITAFGAVATCLNNLGPGLGQVATDFRATDGMEKLMLSLAMIMGRLEIFPILVVLTPGFWRR